MAASTIQIQRTRKVPNRVAHALRLGVFGLQESETNQGDYFRRMKARLGKPEGLVAAAHKFCRIFYGVVHSQRAYDKTEAFRIAPQTTARRRHQLEKRAGALSFRLEPPA